jgi:hypothetical protein
MQRSTRFAALKFAARRPNEDVVFRRHGTLDAASRGRPVFTNTQAFLRGALEKRIAHNHSQRSAARESPDSLRKRDHFPKPCTAFRARSRPDEGFQVSVIAITRFMAAGLANRVWNIEGLVG